MAQEILHPNAKWLFRLNALFTVVFFLIIFGIWSGVFIFSLFTTWGIDISTSLFIVLIIFILLVIILVEIYARLSYKFWKYEFTDSQLRIERGIIWKRYSNIPYQRMQNVDITRGIIARIFGFSTVNIQTAGYSMPARGYGSASEGYLPAVAIEKAEQIREFVIKKITKKKGSGL